jgi:hypothetical protein
LDIVWRPSIPQVKDGRGRRWTPEEIERNPELFDRNGLHCAGCGVQATWQNAHTKTNPRTGETVDVRLHLKLKRHGSEHALSCEYDFDRRADELTHEFPDVIVRLGSTYQLRMPLSSMPQGDNTRPGSRRAAPTLAPATNPVLSAAVRIQQLLHSFAGQPGAQERFRARYGEREDIGWGDFCWHANRSATAFELVSELRRPERQVHPIAVWGLARPVAKTLGQTEYVTLTHTRRGQPAARVRARNPEVLRAYDEAVANGSARQVMGFGDWQAHQLESRRSGVAGGEDHPSTVEARLWVHHPSAVAWW